MHVLCKCNSSYSSKVAHGSLPGWKVVLLKSPQLFSDQYNEMKTFRVTQSRNVFIKGLFITCTYIPSWAKVSFVKSQKVVQNSIRRSAPATSY